MKRETEIAALKTRIKDLDSQLAKAAKLKLAAQAKSAQTACALDSLIAAVKYALDRLPRIDGNPLHQV